MRRYNMRAKEFITETIVKPVDPITKIQRDKPRQPPTHLSKLKKPSEPAAKISFAHELEKYKRLPEGNDEEFHTGGSPGIPFPTTYEQEYKPFTQKGQRRITAMTNEEQVDEKWSNKYKRSINCNNPKGFSQRAHCQGRKKK